MLGLFVAVMISYLLGALPSGYILARAIKGIDIREHGSGNVGATNVFRVVGKACGLTVLLVDIGKGVLAVTLVANCFHHISPIVNLNLYRIILGLCAISGHNWPIFLGFKGGKGIATSTGVLIAILPKALILSAVVWAAVVLIWRYISLGSIAASIALPIFVVILYQGSEGFLWLVLFAVFLSIIAIYKHRPNIRKLLKGHEEKIGK